MTRAKEKEERKAKAITLAQTRRAGEALRLNEEAEFHELFPMCDVSLKFILKKIGGVEMEVDLFASACFGLSIRGKDDFAALIAEKMILDDVNLRSHRTHPKFGFTTLMMAAVFCGPEVVEMLLPHSDAKALTPQGDSAADLARGAKKFANAEYIEAFILAEDEAQMLRELLV